MQQQAKQRKKVIKNVRKNIEKSHVLILDSISWAASSGTIDCPVASGLVRISEMIMELNTHESQFENPKHKESK